MLTDAVKDKIRSAYNQLVQERDLQPRWGQRQMIAEVSKALARDGFSSRPPIAVIEAGTGTGKTIAYTIAAVPVAQARDKRLVISTATVALQEQLIYQDLPDIAKLSGLEFSVALAKGRRRYVCLSRLDQALNNRSAGQTIPLYPDEYDWNTDGDMGVYEACMASLARGDWDGDRDNWPDTIEDRVWFPITSDHAQCTGRRCAYISQCSFFKARDQLADADVIVTNHDLVLSDLSIGGGVVLPAPEDTLYVFDEGHHLAEKAKNHSTAFCHIHSTKQWIIDTVSWLEKAQSVYVEYKLDDLIEKIAKYFHDLMSAVETLEAESVSLRPDSFDGNSQELRFEHGKVPEDLRAASLSCAQLGAKVLGVAERLVIECEDLLDEEGGDTEAVDALLSACQSLTGRLTLTQALWSDFAHSADGEPPPARWLRYNDSGNQLAISCHSSPTLATAFLQDNLWDRAAGVLITSASITALGKFDRFRLHAGTPEDAVYTAVASPFDYQRGRLHIPAHLPEANQAQAHTDAIVEYLPTVFDLARGTLVLFASRRQMREVYEAFKSDLQGTILMQDSQSKKALLEAHKAKIDVGDRSILFGLASFAEGVDLPAEYCEHVIIAKIPFAVPDDPREAALSEWIERGGGNAFREISVPDAGAKLLQACGRLLRTESDQGQISILDTRLLTKHYGRELLASLPPFARITD